MNYVECYKCNKYCHKESECISSPIRPLKQNKQEESSNILKNKQERHEDFVVLLYAQNKGNQWYVDSGCSKNMCGDKRQFLYLKKDKGGSVTFGNNGLERIMVKGTIVLDKGNTKAQNVLYVYGLKHNILSAIQMCD